jgi:serine/threonine protein kinase
LVLRFARDAARGMAYLHGARPPILHRDLKSANLLVDGAYTVKLSDFGLARVKSVAATMTGGLGTPQWTAPEVLSGTRYAESADVYSFGIVLWELLTRRCPYDGWTSAQVVARVVTTGARPGVPDATPPAFAALMRACWDAEPARRPPFRAVLAALDDMARAAGV